jgi:cation diffusion facilitator CzcD-associated flavoprotein CzcO/formylglycine-generating enzyme required for sulfatase activity
MEHLDVLIVGAGLSGIGAAVHLQQRCPGFSVGILEGRDRLGGTWDLFRYPGIRSDSDMHTLGYAFRPWTGARAIADGAAILDYVRATAKEHGLAQLIRYQHRVTAASWSSAEARWTVSVTVGPAQAAQQLSCRFLHVCTGYYNYEHGYTPDFAGMASFGGRIVHPQAWPADLDVSGQRVVVIGSGATAVTLVPALAERAAHVTMLQRSPSYVLARPARDALADWLRRHVPAGLAYGLTRWKNVLLGQLFFQLAKRWPQQVAHKIIAQAQVLAGPGTDIRHLTPRYKPWDQRLCLVPDGDLFTAIRQGRATVVTDQISHFTPTGLQLASGQTLAAEVIVTATGLDLLALGGMALTVDGRPVVLKDCLSYKGMMLSGVPNLAYVVGYTNASWTLKADLTSAYVCRLLQRLGQGFSQCMPVLHDAAVAREAWVDFSSGYIQRSLDRFPGQGKQAPWRLRQNYALDLLALCFGRLADGTLQWHHLPGHSRESGNPRFWRQTTWRAAGIVASLAVAFAAWWLLGQPGLPKPRPLAERSACSLPPSTSPHPGMLWVPAGSFAFGDTVYREETPVRQATVQGFWMDRTEVTNAEFARFVQATGYVTTAERPADARLHPGLPPAMQQPGAVVFVNPTELRNGGDPRQWWQYLPGANWRHPSGPGSSLAGRDAYPVVAVTLADAQAYARWAGRSLPTEREWEWAAGGGQTAPLPTTPPPPPGAAPAQPTQANTWQGFFPLANQASDGFTGLAPVGCFAANGFGLHDMIGNVWELTADVYTDDHSGPDTLPPDQPPIATRPAGAAGAASRHVIKGGSYLCAPNYCMRYRPGARQAQEDDLATSHLGFRTVLRTPGP